MWKGVFPAVTTKFLADDALDHREMERCFGLQIDAGVEGIIVAGSLGEGPMLSLDEKLAVMQTAKGAAGKLPVLMTINEAGTREAEHAARAAAKACFIRSGQSLVPASSQSMVGSLNSSRAMRLGSCDLISAAMRRRWAR